MKMKEETKRAKCRSLLSSVLSPTRKSNKIRSHHCFSFCVLVRANFAQIVFSVDILLLAMFMIFHKAVFKKMCIVPEYIHVE